MTADAGALCVMSGNAAVLRGGSDSRHSSRVIHRCLAEALDQAGLGRDCVQLVPTQDREAVGILLRMTKWIDVVVPRGGKGLVARVQEEARVPVFSHLDGICHTYVEASAELELARRVVINAKLRRTGICGATETLLVDREAVQSHLVPIARDLVERGCEIRADAESYAALSAALPREEADRHLRLAEEQDFYTEYLAPVISVAVVEGTDQAIAHINKYGSHHTEAILSEDQEKVGLFFLNVDSAVLLHNASTQFSDGGEFGFGAEIGIATGKLHARGPVGVEQLTTFKYQIRGTGQCRK